ncbi:MAG: UDP-N-acetylglucosamine 2-epimerase (non-hydrolyzing) [Candidatus Cloacimonetes bacterium]|nr:UDP-N-acetylglucosamine 2-epimerase (non-hydrolyzing) [Candidatus Cloacimonadota bacterium]MCF7869298.1 UDP-N-acetylglucosamine 2-epimerase (non-hydrolyzing) [Candidatus Cloacimonadota bacterium]MCF7884720.1 UDP-N-acetylglucosamine 2-epimerase (non-hydrolyzing) [Candidatus Cloacimonadota bacterium]
MKALVIFGTRPEIIKLAPVIFKLNEKMDVRVFHTRQHDELADDVIKFFKITPDFNERTMLNMTEERRSGRIGQIIRAINPDIIIVQGDTFTTYAAAFTAFLLRKPVLHLEAGLRTFRKYSPFPEEMFRRLVSNLSDFHFVPTTTSKQNLLNEGIPEDRIVVSGNTIVDAANMAIKRVDEEAAMAEIHKYNHDDDLDEMLETNQLVVITSHRRENIGQPLKRICSAAKQLAAKYENLLFIWVLHKNPNVREIVFNELKDRPKNLKFVEALSYPAMLYFLDKAHLILTDSGGIQEEVVSLHKPVIILREDTERPEVVEYGLGFMVGTDIEKIMATFTKLNEDIDFYKTLTKIDNPFGDGKTADRVLEFLTSPEVENYLKNYPDNANHVFKTKIEW